MRRAVLFLALAAACEPVDVDSRPVRLVAGVNDTVIVNNRRAIRIPMRVLDGAGRILPDSGVRYQWRSGTPVSVTAAGVATCDTAGDATIQASLGPIATRVVLRCRPVDEVRSLRMLNLVIGDPPQELPFEAVDAADQPVALLTGQLVIRDSSIATAQGLSIVPRAAGATSLDMRIGDHTAHASVHVYRPVATFGVLQPGDHVALAVSLSPGDLRRFRLPAAREVYFVTVIPDREAPARPRLAIVGAGCMPGLDVASHFCLARQDAEVIVYHPPRTGAAPEARGTLAIWRQEKP